MSSPLGLLREELRKANLEAMAKRIVEDPFDHLDGSLKRNTALIKKLRLINQDTVGGILEEMERVRQSRFLGESIQAISENRPKTSAELMAVMRVCSRLVQRYHGAEWMLVGRLVAIAKESEGDLVTTRQMLRWVTECLGVGIVGDPKVLFDLLKALLPEDDLKGPGQVSIAAFFAKHYYRLFTCAGFLEDVEWRERIVGLVVSYFRSMCRLLVRQHGRCCSLQSRSKSIYENVGDLNQRQTAALQQAMAAVEQLSTSLTDLAAHLDLPMPPLLQSEPEAQPSLSEGGKIVFTDFAAAANRSPSWDPRIWDSQEERAFYEDFLCLAERLPSALLAGENNMGEEAAASTTTTEEFEAAFDNAQQVDPEAINNKLAHLSSLSAEASGTSSTAATSSTVASFIASLGAIHSAALVDQACLDFCLLNSRSLRKNIAEYLIELARNRIDLIPFIGRFLATLKPHFPAIIEAVCESITGQFHFLWKNMSLSIAGTRSRICRYIAELTKFRVLPQGMAFTCLKKAIDDFSLYNIDMASLLLESCGRFLYHQPESHRRIEILMEIVERKKRQAPLSESQFLQITNALASVNPPQVTPVARPRRSAHEAFILHLIRTELTDSTAERIFRQLRMLDWQDPVTLRTLKSAFLKVWKVRYGEIGLLAAMVGSLQKYHADFCIELVDDLVGEIRLGLDHHNKAVWQQQRIAVIRYLGQLYIYNVVDADLIFALLAQLLTYGHAGGLPRKEASLPSPIDPPTDHFRIRLSALLLQTIAEYVGVGPLAPVLDQYLCLFQYYIECKEGPLSVDLEYLVDDLFEQLGRPWTWRRDHDGALAALESITGTALFHHHHQQPSSSSTRAEAKAEQLEALRQEQQQREADFEADLSGMISESLAHRRLEKRAPAFDAVVPLATRVVGNSTTATTSTLRLLTRRRNRLQAREIDLADDVSDKDPSLLFSNIQAMAEQKRLETIDIASRTLRLTLQGDSEGTIANSFDLDGRNNSSHTVRGRGRGGNTQRPFGRGRGGVWRGSWATYNP